MIGADTRCASPYNASSMSSFIRVAKPTDTPGNFSLDLWMSYPQSWSSGAFPVDPIDSLQTKFDNWIASSTGNIIPNPGFNVSVYEANPGVPTFILSGNTADQEFSLTVIDICGRTIAQQQLSENRTQLNLAKKLEPGLYFYILRQGSTNKTVKGKFLLL
jgi:hypothetical protein